MGSPREITRTSAKFWVEDRAAVSGTAAEYIPVFHRWIQHAAVPGLLIDVADYGHVPEGPGVMLIGHEADRALDLAGGPGFRFEGKRVLGPAADQIAEAVAGAASGAALLASDPTLDGVRFDPSRVRIGIADRIHAPNDDATLASLAPAIAEALARVFPGAEGELTRHGDARRPFTVDVALAAPVALDVAPAGAPG
jgi:hypothetical protein